MISHYVPKLNTLSELPFDQAVAWLEEKTFQFGAAAVSEMEEVVTYFVLDLAERVAALDQRLKGTLLPMGSFPEGTKIGKMPDEFDFLLALSNDGLLVNWHENNIFVLDQDSPWMAKGTDQLFKVDQRGRAYVDALSLVRHFRVLVDGVLRWIPLPEGLQHGGALAPNCTGRFDCRPGATMLFILLLLPPMRSCMIERCAGEGASHRARREEQFC